jgi:hypothetical protein
MRRTVLARGSSRLKRTRLKVRPRRHRESSLRERVRLNREEMGDLRFAAYERSGGMCECWRLPGQTPCKRTVSWRNGHLHHLIRRGMGGSDIMGNVAYISPKCHREIHGEPQWTRRTA